MVRTGVEPACQQDLNLYAADKAHNRYTKRNAAYNAIDEACDRLEGAIAGVPHGEAPVVAAYCRDVLKPLLVEVRSACDAAEGLVKNELWPFPSYTDVCFGHHLSPAPVKP
jgi:glutamine synthetase type III